MGTKEIYRIDPDGDLDYDGEESVEDEADAYERDWETSTFFL